MREHEAPVNTPLDTYTLTARNHQYELAASSGIPPLRIMLLGEESGFVIDCRTVRNIVYEMEHRRGYIWRGDLWSPGYFSAELLPGCEATLVASAENWNVLCALSPRQAWDAEHD